MTPKEQYEARKAERKARVERQNAAGFHTVRGEQDFLEFLDLADRFVTAAERIADALEVSNQRVSMSVGDTHVSHVAGASL